MVHNEIDPTGGFTKVFSELYNFESGLFYLSRKCAVEQFEKKIEEFILYCWG